MQRVSGGVRYNVLYLHAEQDWVQQCGRRERAAQGEQLPSQPEMPLLPDHHYRRFFLAFVRTHALKHGIRPTGEPQSFWSKIATHAAAVYAVSLTACLPGANCPFPGQPLDNCMNNTGTVGDSLQVHSVDTKVGCLCCQAEFADAE